MKPIVIECRDVHNMSMAQDPSSLHVWYQMQRGRKAPSIGERVIKAVHTHHGSDARVSSSEPRQSARQESDAEGQETPSVRGKVIKAARKLEQIQRDCLSMAQNPSSRPIRVQM